MCVYLDMGAIRLKVRITGLFFCLILLAQAVFAQEHLSIEKCYELAKKNYPLIKQIDLLEKSKKYQLHNAAKLNFPQLSLGGQATEQSDVTNLPISVPGITIPAISKDQYKIYGEVYQPLTGFYEVSRQRKQIKANADAEIQRVEVQLYALKERINQLFFSILLLNAQIEEVRLLKKDVKAGLEKVNVAIKNGTAISSDAALLKAEVIKAEQREIELTANRKAFVSMLGTFIHRTISDDVVWEQPILSEVDTQLRRPELKLYDLQKRTIEMQRKHLNSRYIPHIGLFFQQGYGRPALNFLSNEATDYSIGGVRFSWSLSSLYTIGSTKKILRNNSDAVDIQRETFLLNTNLANTQQTAEIKKIEDLIAKDEELIALREQIVKTAQSRLQNGLISSLDFITYVDAKDRAKQDLLSHQIQLLMAQYKLKYNTGN